MSLYSIPEPCHKDWDEMSPQEQGRHCTHCDKVVVDMTGMSNEQAVGILETSRAQFSDSCETGICARVQVDSDGKILMPKPIQKPMPKRRHRLLTDGMAAMLAVSLWGCAGTGEQQPTDTGAASIPVTAPGSAVQIGLVEHVEPIIEPKPIIKGRVRSHAEPIEVIGEVMIATDETPKPATVPVVLEKDVIECRTVMGIMAVSEPIQIPREKMGEMIRQRPTPETPELNQ